MSVIRRRIAALLVVPVLAMLVVGCAGVREQTQAWREAPHGTSATAGDIDIRNALVVASPDGNGTVFASFANRGDGADALTGVIVNGEEVSPADGELAIPARGYAAAAPDGSRVDVAGLDVQPGRLVEIQFIFANAPRVTIDALVQPNEGIYADVTF